MGWVVINLVWKHLTTLARFWNRPAELVAKSGAENIDYKMSEKAYVMDATGNTVNVELKASENSPLYNPAFELKNWNSNGAVVKIDGKIIEEDKDCRIGFKNTKEGNDLIVWLRMNETKSVNMSFSKK